MSFKKSFPILLAILYILTIATQDIYTISEPQIERIELILENDNFLKLEICGKNINQQLYFKKWYVEGGLQEEAFRFPTNFVFGPNGGCEQLVFYSNIRDNEVYYAAVALEEDLLGVDCLSDEAQCTSYAGTKLCNNDSEESITCCPSCKNIAFNNNQPNFYMPFDEDIGYKGITSGPSLISPDPWNRHEVKLFSADHRHPSYVSDTTIPRYTLDFNLSENIPVLAVANGRIQHIGDESGFGHYIYLEHDDLNSTTKSYTVYAHLNESPKELFGEDWRNAEVVQGQVIGFVGNTGGNYKYHLHFEYRNFGYKTHSSNEKTWYWARFEDCGDCIPDVGFQYFSFNREKHTFQYDFHDQAIPNPADPETTGTTTSVSFTLKNVGLKEWNPENVFLRPIDENGKLIEDNPLWKHGLSGWDSPNKIRLKDQTPVDELGEFEFEIYIPSNVDLNSEGVFRFDLFVNDTIIEGSGVSFILTVQCSDGEYCDVPSTSIFYPYIKYMGEDHITNTACRGEYKPFDLITRGQAALMIARWLEGDKYLDFPISRIFTDWDGLPDVPDENISDEIKKAAEYLNARGDEEITALNSTGIFSGDALGRFNANDHITRGQTMKVLVLALESSLGKPIEYPPIESLRIDFPYPDVDESSNLEEFILKGTFLGFASGYSDGLFRPDDPISRQGMAKLISGAEYYKNEERRLPNRPDTQTTHEFYEEYLASYSNGSICSQNQINNLAFQSTQNNSMVCFPAAKESINDEVNVPSDGVLVCYLNETDSFITISDVDPDSFSRTAIENLFDNGITDDLTNCGHFLFCPTDKLSREELSVWALRSLYHYQTGEPGTNYVPQKASIATYSDVPLSHEYADWIYAANDKGIMFGGTNGKFEPNKPATRTHIAVVVIRTLYGLGEGYELSQLPQALGIFEDIELNGDELSQSLAATYEELYWLGLTNGCSSQGIYFCPDQEISRSDVAVIFNRAFIDPVISTKRVGELCFSTRSSYQLSYDLASGLNDVNAGDIVCYHKNARRFKMLFNSSVHDLNNININAVTIPTDGEIWFSTRNDRTIPDIGDVNQGDMIRYENGVFSIALDVSQIPELENEDIDGFHRYSSSLDYLSIGGNADFGFDTFPHDIVSLSSNNQLDRFFDGSDLEIPSSFDLNGFSVIANNASHSEIYLTLGKDFCLEANDGSTLCGRDSDVILYNGPTGTNSSGGFEPALCFDGEDYDNLRKEDINALHVSDAFVCNPNIVLPDPPYGSSGDIDYGDSLLSTSPASLNFSGISGESTTASKSFTVASIGAQNKAISWYASYSQPWLSLSQISGTTPNSVSISVDATNLAPGSYSDTIVLSPTDPNIGARIIEVSFVVNPAPASVPIILEADSGHTNIQLHWNPTNDATVAEYQIQRTEANTNNYATVATIPAFDTTYFDADDALVPGTEYCYQIVAIRGNGEVARTSSEACAEINLLQLWVTNGSAAPGEKATINVGIANANGFAMAASEIWLTFDNDALAIDNVTPSSLTNGYATDWETFLEPGHITRLKITLISPAPRTLYDDGALFHINFNVIGSEFETVPLEFDAANSFIAVPDIGGGSIQIPLDLSNGSFTIGETNAYITGDPDGNGLVQYRDSEIVLQISHAEIIPTDEQLNAGDVNSDGQIDAEDVTLIIYFIENGDWPNPSTQQSLFAAQSAAAQTPIALSVENVSALSGEKTDVLISATGLVNVAGGSLTLTYDPALVESIESVSPTSDIDTFNVEFVDKGNGIVDIAFYGGEPVSGDIDLLNISFLMAEGLAENVITPLTVSNMRFNDIYGLDFEDSVNQIAFSVTNGSIRIEGHPILNVSHHLAYFRTGESDNKQIIISNLGNGELSWSASESVSWLSINQSTGLGDAFVTLTVNTSDLENGIYEGELFIFNVDDPSQSETIKVILEVSQSKIYLPIVIRQ